MAQREVERPDKNREGHELNSRSDEMVRTGVYILLCSNGKYYVGSSEDVDRRIEEHQRGKTKSLRYVLPVELKAFIECKTVVEARRLEYKIKKMKSRKYVVGLIEEFGVAG